MSHALTEFEQAILSHGLEPGEIIPDGKIQRVSSNGSGQDKAGYYALFDNGGGVLGGFFGDWRTGLYETWFSSKTKDLSKEDQAKFKAKIETARKQTEQQRKEDAGKAAEKARSMWEACKEAGNDHPYLKKKQVQAYGLRESKQGQLVIPVMDTAGQIQSLQFVGSDGSKKFLTGGHIGGNFFAIKGKREVLYVCEGYATGASIHLATGQTVVCAFNAGNLKLVAQAVRKRHPKANLVIAADSDQWTEGNPGKAKGMDAAKEVKGLLALPLFKDESSRPTDFNDLARLEGLETVRLQLLDAKQPENKPEAKHFPFTTRADGVYYLEEDKDGGVTPVKICSPLEVVAVTHNDLHEQWGRLLKVTDQKGILHYWAMPLRMTRSGRGEFIEELCDMGLRPVPGRKAGDRIRLFISDHPTSETVLCVERIGWHGDSFVLPERSFSPSGPGKVVFQGAVREHNFRTKGTLQQWQERIARYAVGNSRFALALSIAFTGPLLHLAGGESGGFHFLGDSSAGKSTLILAASSVCGGGPSGYHRQWRTTDNALEAIASGHCDTLLCLDEMGQCEARVVAETSYMLANGQGKQRLSKGAALRNAYAWRLIFLSTGEVSCAEKIQEGGGRMKPGQEVRVIDLPASPARAHGVFETLHEFETGAAMADHLRSVSGRFYGHALQSFLSELIPQADDVRSIARTFLAEFESRTCPANAPGTVRRVCKRFAVVALAGTLATDWGVLPWPPAQATEAATTCFQDWIQARGGATSMDALRGVEHVREFIQAHGSSRFEVLGFGDSQKVVNRAGYKRKDEGGDWVYLIFKDTFRREVCAGLDVGRVCRELKQRGALLFTGGRNVKYEWVEGKSTDFYAIRESGLASDQECDLDQE